VREPTSKRALTSSVKANEVGPSMLILLSSYKTIKRPRRRCPASDAASAVIPSIKQPARHHRSSTTARRLHQEATSETRTIATEDVGEVGEQLEAGLVVRGAQVSLRNGESDGVREALSERTRRHLDTGKVRLGMTRSTSPCLRSELSCAFEGKLAQASSTYLLPN